MARTPAAAFVIGKAAAPYPMALISETACAKINLTLRVLGKREDGYHEIESLVAFADAGEEVVLDLSRPAGVETFGPFAAAIDGPNLVATALQRCASAEPRLRLGRVLIDKRLPVAAGIGGGSADAGAVLRAIARANAELAPGVPWLDIAASLGADVPVCYHSCPAIIRGAGERIEAVAALPRLDVVLVNPLVPVPSNKTALVFQAMDAPRLGIERRPGMAMCTAISDRASLVRLMGRLGNDLFAPACEVIPDIVAVITALERSAGIELAQLSGAGPTCFGVFPTEKDAREAARRLEIDYPHWWILATTI